MDGEKSPFIALLLSFFMPGLGNIYNGQVKRGIIQIIILYLITFVFSFLLLIYWPLVLYDSYNQAIEHNKNLNNNNYRRNNENNYYNREHVDYDNNKHRHDDIINEKSHIEKINVNTATTQQLANIPLLNIVIAKDITDLRKEGKYITSFDDLIRRYQLRQNDINELRKYLFIEEVIVDDDEIISDKDNKQEKNYNPVEKIDINTASVEQISQIPVLTIIQAKKIVQNRNNGYYIHSFDELKNLLNLKDYQIRELDKYILINKDTIPTKKSSGRRVDL